MPLWLWHSAADIGRPCGPSQIPWVSSTSLQIPVLTDQIFCINSFVEIAVLDQMARLAPLAVAAIALTSSSQLCSADVTLGLNFAELSGGSQNSWPFSDIFRHAGPFTAVRRAAGSWVWDRDNRIILDPLTRFPTGVDFTAGGTSLSAGQAFVASTLPFLNYAPSQTIPAYLPGPHVLLWRE